MEEARRGATDKDRRQQNQRQAEATSKETLEDLEESAKISSTRSGSSDDRSMPTPDGQPVETRPERADGSDKGGPV